MRLIEAARADDNRRRTGFHKEALFAGSAKRLRRFLSLVELFGLLHTGGNKRMSLRHFAARHEEMLSQFIADNAVRVERVLHQLAGLRLSHARQHAEIDQQTNLARHNVVFFIALHHRHHDGGRRQNVVRHALQLLVQIFDRHHGARRLGNGGFFRRAQRGMAGVAEQVDVIAADAAVRNRHVQIRRLTKNGIRRRLVRIEERVHAEVRVLFVGDKRQADLAVQRRLVAEHRDRRGAHGRHAALHVARAASVNQIALFRRADGCVLPVADTRHHVQMAAVFQNLVAFAEGRDEVRAVVAQILHLARDAFAVKDLLETERAALLVSRRVDGILRHQRFKNFQRQSIVDHLVCLTSGNARRPA